MSEAPSVAKNARTDMEWTGNHIKGSEMSQKRKKHIKSRVLVPEDAGIEFAAGGTTTLSLDVLRPSRDVVTHGCCLH